MYDRFMQAGAHAQLVIVKNARHALIEPDAMVSPSLMEIYQIMVDVLVKYVQ